MAKTNAKTPLVRMVKRDAISSKKAWVIRGIAVLASLVVCAILFLCLGKNPIVAYRDMILGAFGTRVLFNETVKTAVPLLLCAMGIAFAFKMKFWNIGGEGQILMGAIGASYFAYFHKEWPHVLLIIVMILAAIVCGGIYGLIPALFKSKWNTNETLFTLMLNYIALYFIIYLENNSWKAPGTTYPKFAMFSPNARIAQILGIQWGWIAIIILCVIAWIYFNKTKQGYEVAVVGESNATARYAGINVGSVFKRTMFLSGAFCGLAGFFQTAGNNGLLAETTAGGVGFTAITVAWMAKMNPYAMLVIAFFISVLERGCNKIETTIGIPASVSDLIIGIILFFILGCEFFINYRLIFKKGKEAK